MYLSEKLKKICNDLNWSQKMFISNYLESDNSIISESTLNHLFAGHSDKMGRPKIDTIKSIVDFCKTIDNTKYKNISIEYFLNDDYIEIETENINLYEITGLNKKTLDNIKKMTKNESYILNKFICDIDEKFWNTLYSLKVTYSTKKIFEDIFLKYNDIIYPQLKTTNEIIKEFSNNSRLQNIIINGEKLRKSKKDYLDYTEEEYQIYDEYCHLPKYPDILKNRELLENIKKGYNINSLSEIKKMYHDFKRNLKNFELFEEVYNLRYPEMNLITNYFLIYFKIFESFINNEILITKELYNTLFFIKSDIDGFFDKLKYEVSEYLTLYMNK